MIMFTVDLHDISIDGLQTGFTSLHLSFGAVPAAHAPLRSLTGLVRVAPVTVRAAV